MSSQVQALVAGPIFDQHVVPLTSEHRLAPVLLTWTHSLTKGLGPKVLSPTDRFRVVLVPATPFVNSQFLWMFSTRQQPSMLFRGGSDDQLTLGLSSLVILRMLLLFCLRSFIANLLALAWSLLQDWRGF